MYFLGRLELELRLFPFAEFGEQFSQVRASASQAKLILGVRRDFLDELRQQAAGRQIGFSSLIDFPAILEKISHVVVSRGQVISVVEFVGELFNEVFLQVERRLKLDLRLVSTPQTSPEESDAKMAFDLILSRFDIGSRLFGKALPTFGDRFEVFSFVRAQFRFGADQLFDVRAGRGPQGSERLIAKSDSALLFFVSSLALFSFGIGASGFALSGEHLLATGLNCRDFLLPGLDQSTCGPHDADQ